MTKRYVPIEGNYNSVNGLLTVEGKISNYSRASGEQVRENLIRFSSLLNHSDRPSNTVFYMTKEEAVQLENSLHSLIVEISKEELKAEYEQELKEHG